MQLTPDKARKRQLAIAVPLQEIQFSDVQRLSRTTVARNDVDCQIVPGGRPARGYNLPALIRKNDVWLGNEVYLREAPTKEIRVAPVACCRFAVEQVGCRQQYRARTRRINRIARAIALAEPFLQFRIALPQVVIGSKPKLRNDNDVCVGLFVDRQLRTHRNAVSAPERITRERDNFRPDQPPARLVADELAP